MSRFQSRGPASDASPPFGATAPGGAAETGEAAAAIGAAERITAFPLFQPQTFSLAEVAHRPDRVRVWLDGSRIEPGCVRRSGRQGVYTIDGPPVPHGAIVRIDFEPPLE